MDYPVSDELRAQLSGQKMLGTMVGAVEPNWMKWANDAIDAGTDIDAHSPSGGEDRPNGKPRLRIIRARPFLAVIDGGRA
ncbi:MAG TPA: hypothetical protein VGN60_07670 [Devosia sp.]|jgi:hypothetical protein|nr:hypothetical protein [Devosia sp.]